MTRIPAGGAYNDYLSGLDLQEIYGDTAEETIEDGFGNAWSAYCPECGQKTVSIVRPGKVQCSKCG